MNHPITLELRVAAILAVAALNDLWLQDQEDDGCCPQCCGPCWALKQLLDTGDLDDIVLSEAEGYDWWSEEFKRVDRDFLTRAWRMTDCHSWA